MWRLPLRSSGSARAPAAILRSRRRGASCDRRASGSPDMRSASLAAATERVNQSRRELRSAVRRLGAELARPSSLVAVASAAAVLGFSLERLGGASTLARALTTVLHHGA